MQDQQIKEIAIKIRQQNLDNIVDKAERGDVLSAGELKQIEQMAAGEEPGVVYRNFKEAWRELRRRKLFDKSYRAFTNHIHEGKCRQDGKTITEAALEKYIRKYLTATDDVDMDDAKEKLRLEIKIKKWEERLKAIEVRKAEDTLIDRDESVAQICGVIEAAKSELEQLCTLKAAEWAEAALKGADFLGATIWQDLKDMFRNLSSYDEIIIEDAEGAGAEA